MTLIGRQIDSGEGFVFQAKWAFAEALKVLEDSSFAELIAKDARPLIGFCRILDEWRADFTLTPRETIGGTISGLTRENADKVYHLLDAVLKGLASRFPKTYTRNSFADDVTTSIQTAINFERAKQETRKYKKTLAALGVSINVALPKQQTAIPLRVVKIFLARSLEQLRKG